MTIIVYETFASVVYRGSILADFATAAAAERFVRGRGFFPRVQLATVVGVTR